jgi:hypothetical protein
MNLPTVGRVAPLGDERAAADPPDRRAHHRMVCK